MAIIPINGVGEVGINVDVPPQALPMNAWSGGKNVRMRNGGVEKILGEIDIFGATPVPFYYVLPVVAGTNYYWVAAGLDKVYAVSSGGYTNITRQTAGVDVDYSAMEILGWTGGTLGGIPVINNGLDVPQMWLPVDTAQKLQALSNWNVNHTCGTIKPFKTYLVALDITKSGTRYPYMVKWSHPADPGAVPSSWDETDPTKDAGEYELRDTSGYLLDCATLRDVNVLYKEDSTWMMQFIGGEFVFRFSKMFSTIGLLARRCVVEVPGGKHAVFGNGDIVVHDGQQAISLINRRMRSAIFNSIDTSNYVKSFVVDVPEKSEVWFCFPETGSDQPTQALVWNWETNAVGLRDLEVFYATTGIAELVDDSWDSDSGSWESDSSLWGDRAFNPTAKRVVGAAPSLSALRQLDWGTDTAGTPFTSYIERVGLGVPLRVNQPPDITTMKFLRSFWPQISGTTGGVVNIYLGSQQYVDGPITYQSPRQYTIGSNAKIDCRVSGRLFAIKVESTTAIEWRLSGYELDVVPAGSF